MKERYFLDTSVLIAAFWGDHPCHEASLPLVSDATKDTACCGAHTLAEVYAGLTAMPVRPMIPPEQALLFLESIRPKVSVVTLSGEEYWAVIRDCANRGLSSGRIYDALLLRCAEKSRATHIYTWNLKHFRSLASQDLIDRVRTP